MVVVVSGVHVDDVEDGKHLGVFTVDDSELRKDRLRWLEKQMMLRSKQEHANLLEVGKPLAVNTEGKKMESDSISSFNKKIEAMKKELTTQMEAYQKVGQDSLDAAYKRLKKCTTDSDSGNRRWNAMWQTSVGMRSEVTKCIKNENNWYRKQNTCMAKCVKPDPGPCPPVDPIPHNGTSNCKTECSRIITTTGQPDDVEQWLGQMEALFSGKLAAYNSQRRDCGTKIADYSKCVTECSATTATWKEILLKCETKAKDMDLKACHSVSGSGGDCTKATRCYNDAKENYDRKKTFVQEKEKTFTGEVEMWSKVSCIFKQLVNGQPICNASAGDVTKWKKCITKASADMSYKFEFNETGVTPACAQKHTAPCGTDYAQEVWKTSPTHQSITCTACLIVKAGDEAGATPATTADPDATTADPDGGSFSLQSANTTVDDLTKGMTAEENESFIAKVYALANSGKEKRKQDAKTGKGRQS